jgi:acetyltransferase-like isoleucine patch superfamily enzyme
MNMPRLVKRRLRRALRAIVAAVSEPDEPESYFTAELERYNRFTVGEGTYGKPTVLYDGDTSLTIGRYCSIASDVTILLGGEHHSGWVTTYPFSAWYDGARDFPGYPYSKGDVVIGHDVWLGYGVCILSGVTIGSGAIVAACSIVTKDVAPYSIVAGSPARQIRVRFPPETVEALLRIRWWTWPLAQIEEAWPLLLSDNVEKFVSRYQSESRNRDDKNNPSSRDI